MPFNHQQVEKILQLQAKSYKLLLWVARTLKHGGLDFTKIHGAMSSSAVAEEWINRHFASIPPEARPEIDIVSEFSHLFASYLMTSFELVEQPGVVWRSDHNCYCTMCRYLVAANHLKTRSIKKKHIKSAFSLKKLYLQTLADEAEIPLLVPEIEGLLSYPNLAEDIATATYVRELMRRAEFASQGEGVLVLWREIAWEGMGPVWRRKPKKNFELSTDKVLLAEKIILEAMENI